MLLNEFLELECIVTPPKKNPQDLPHDELCKVHFYGTKENIMQRTWEKGSLKFYGDQINLLQDFKTIKIDISNEKNSLPSAGMHL